MFLRGKSMFHGKGVTLKHIIVKSNQSEARAVYDSIIRIHDEDGIPYDEIAVIMYNASFKKRIKMWKESKYDLDTPLLQLLKYNDIPFCQMYSTDTEWSARYGDSGGVKLIKVLSVLGLDFRAAVVCGLPSLGEYNQVKNPNWDAKPSTTTDLYAHVLQEAESRVADAMGSILFSTRKLLPKADDTQEETAESAAG
jgi:hypothetical protein